MSAANYECANKSCGALFTARTADRARGWAKFCSKSCKAVRQEATTGQHRDYLARQQSHDQANRAGLDAMEDGWDGHKNVF